VHSPAGLLGEHAALLGELSGLDTVAVPVAGETAACLSSVSSALPPDTTAIYLTDTDPRGRRLLTADLVNTGMLIITSDQMTAIALTAALLTHLGRIGVHPRVSRAVIVEPEIVPSLYPLLVAAGIGDVTWRNPINAHDLEPHRFIRLTDAVIDPRQGRPSPLWQAAESGHPLLITANDPTHPMLVLPGLLRAALRAGRIARFDNGTYYACARALMACTSLGELLPSLHDPDLTQAVTGLAVRALAARDGHRRRYDSR
jgi:malate dehydrogenase (oxaloacetate-decarboxylating)